MSEVRPMTEKQKELKAKHGTPRQFAEACERAADGLMISTEECRQSIQKYEREWMEAGQ